MVRQLPALAVLCAAALALVGCNTMPSEVRGSIAARLPAMLGPADRYDVHVDGDFLELLRGKLDRVVIDGKNVAISPLLTVANLHAEADNIHANVHTDAVESIGSTSFAIDLDQADLDGYMRAAHRDEFARGARITVGRSALTYSNAVRFLDLSTPYSVTGALKPHAGRSDQLDFVPSRGSVARLPIPHAVLQLALSRINPVVDLSQMKYPVRIGAVSVASGIMAVSGTVVLTNLIGIGPGTAAPAARHA